MNYVNLGCGGRFHPAWTNIDIVSTGPGVIAHDLSRGVPLASESCEVVYHSHVLEHLRRADVERFMRDCHRVLRPGGILRVAVPDLERICRAYVAKLEAALRGDAAAEADYDWIMLELYDQTVREEGGGEMRRYLAQPELSNEAFVYERIGVEGRLIRDELLKENRAPSLGGKASRFFGRSPRSLVSGLRRRAKRLLLGPSDVRACAVGHFRLRGEVHQWMYDRFSLGRLMLLTGFVDPVVQTATASLIDDWKSFSLDTLSDGTVNKPDSLYMEARRPARTNPVSDRHGV
jgi:SAM-dependent methyltransferase